MKILQAGKSMKYETYLFQNCGEKHILPEAFFSHRPGPDK